MRQESCHKAPAMEEMREGGKSEKVVKLFGVRIAGDVGGGKAEDAATAAVAEEEDEEDVMRKSWSVGNLTSCSAFSSAADHGSGDHGYHSDGGLLQSSSGKRKRRDERKKGVPWTKEEHRTFLAGLQKLGKGDWRGISQKFVTTRTPTQVASHAQKYFLRQNDHGKQKRRSSLFDVKINDEAAGIETSLIPSSKKLKVVGEDIYRLSQKNNSTNFPAYFTSHVQTPAGEASSNFQHIANHSDMAGLSDNCAKEQPMNIPDEKGMQGQTKIACHPDLLRLSLSYSNCQTQSSPTTQINDLELRIAPPQPHTLSNMSFIVQQVK